MADYTSMSEYASCKGCDKSGPDCFRKLTVEMAGVLGRGIANSDIYLPPTEKEFNKFYVPKIHESAVKDFGLDFPIDVLNREAMFGRFAIEFENRKNSIQV